MIDLASLSLLGKKLDRIWCHVYTPGVKTKVFKSGNSLAIRLPKDLELPCGTVSIRREGTRIVIEEIAENGWPADFFESIRIPRKEFARENLTYTEKTL